MEFYVCKTCGNIITKLKDSHVPVSCCGKHMDKIVAGSVEAATEKHIPVYELDSNTVHVTVGSVEHPMTQEHYIEWICLESEHGIQYAHLDPDDEPRAKFALCEGDKVRAVYAFCNQHDLWRN